MRIAIIEKKLPRDLKELKKSQLTLAGLINDYEKKKLPISKPTTQSAFQSLIGWKSIIRNNHHIIFFIPKDT